jgi:pilus assembly protein CpaC
MVNAKGAGKATVVVWAEGEPAVTYHVTVRDEVVPFDQTREELQKRLGDKVTVSGDTDTLVLTGTVKDEAEARRMEGLASAKTKKVVNLLQMEPPAEPRQILLQVRFASINRVALSEIGFNYFSTNDKTIGALSTQQFPNPRFGQLQFDGGGLQNNTVNFSDLLNIFVFRPDLNIGATIKALASRNLLQILAEPNLITIEGKEASFLAGGSFPFPVLTSTPTGGAIAPVITIQFKPFGVQLNFTPTVTPSGAIQLKVAPEVSALDYTNAVTLQGFLIPALSQRRAETEVLLRDGESFAIAGLIDNRVIQTLERVWGLGDIPIIGHLFRSRSTRKTADELLVVVTTRFVKPLSPDEKAKLPDFQETFLPAVDPKKSEKVKTPDPSFIGPRGHQQPDKP